MNGSVVPDKKKISLARSDNELGISSEKVGQLSDFRSSYPLIFCRWKTFVDEILMLNVLYNNSLCAKLMFYTCEFSDCLMNGRKFASIEAVGEQCVRMIVRIWKEKIRGLSLNG